ncbi:MAG: hypothetical protein MUC43_00990 [Pirellula sp.]|nr:hypothetical protein [Pirellula sp.]
MAREEQTIAVIPGKEPSERLVLALDSNEIERPLVLRSESFSPDVGWFAQSSMRLSRMELNGLRSVLGIPQSNACHNSARSISEHNTDSDSPRILSIAAYRRA